MLTVKTVEPNPRSDKLLTVTFVEESGKEVSLSTSDARRDDVFPGAKLFDAYIKAQQKGQYTNYWLNFKKGTSTATTTNTNADKTPSQSGYKDIVAALAAHAQLTTVGFNFDEYKALIEEYKGRL